jgi:hypothetical protein
MNSKKEIVVIYINGIKSKWRYRLKGEMSK